MEISDNILAAFYAKNSSLEENEMILHKIIDDDYFEEVIEILDEVNSLDLEDLEETFYESETVIVKPNFRKTMGNKTSHVAAAGVAGVAANKLVAMVSTGRFNHLLHGNVASNLFGDPTERFSNVGAGETAGSVGTGETAGSVGAEEGSGSVGFAQAETAHGLPELDIEFDPSTYQYYPDSCAFQSQAIILREYGIDVTQEELMQVAKEQGWYVEGYGTPEDKVGKLLEHYGLDTSITKGNNIFNLTNELAQGHRVLVTVDSGELWTPGLSEKAEDLVCQKADHALLVVGVDTTDPKDVKVIVTDPGNGNTQYAYSERQFMDAWKDSKCFMAATTESPEEYLAHEDYPPMETFADIPYDSISRLADSHILMTDESNYHEFFDDLMNNPDHLNELMDEYPDLFLEDDEMDFGDDDVE